MKSDDTPVKSDPPVVDAALAELAALRRDQMATLLPHSLVFGFDVVPSADVKSPTILLPAEDYAIFEALYTGPEGDAVRAMTVSAAAPAHAPQGAASDTGDPMAVPSSLGGVPGEHRFYLSTDRDVPEQIRDRNNALVLDMCRICGQAEGDLEPTCPGPRP